MTTAARIDKLYTQLTPEKLAGLAFEASVRGNKTELETIRASVKGGTFISLDQRFSRLNTAYIELGLFYSMT